MSEGEKNKKQVVQLSLFGAMVAICASSILTVDIPVVKAMLALGVILSAIGIITQLYSGADDTPTKMSPKKVILATAFGAFFAVLIGAGFIMAQNSLGHESQVECSQIESNE